MFHMQGGGRITTQSIFVTRPITLLAACYSSSRRHPKDSIILHLPPSPPPTMSDLKNFIIHTTDVSGATQLRETLNDHGDFKRFYSNSPAHCSYCMMDGRAP
jgi:hypothetical protein